MLKCVLTFDKGLVLRSDKFSCSKLASLSFISDKEVRSSNFCVSKALLDKTSYKTSKYVKLQISYVKLWDILPSATLLPFVSKYLFSPEVSSPTLESYSIVRRLVRTKLILPYAMLHVHFLIFSTVPEKQINKTIINILLMKNYIILKYKM